MKRLLQSKWLMVAGCLVLFGFGASLVRRAPEFFTVKKEMKHLQDTIDQIRHEQDELERKRAYYQSDSYLEQQARIRLNYMKPGEQVVAIYRTAGQEQDAITAPRPLNNFKLWWYYFLGRF